MYFSNLAYAKLHFDYNKELFIKEYDEKIYSRSIRLKSGYGGLVYTTELNKRWKMVDPSIYHDIETEVILENGRSYSHKHKLKAWKYRELMQAELSEEDGLEAKNHNAIGVGVGFRNRYFHKNFTVRKSFENLHIVDWIFKNLPFEKIVSIHCVALDTGSFAPIHRDDRDLFSQGSSIGSNNFYKNNHVIININISNGGVPLFWGLDSPDDYKCHTADDDIYITNDYFLHGVPVCTSRRRQIRVCGVPKLTLMNYIDQKHFVAVSKNYQYDPTYPG